MKAKYFFVNHLTEKVSSIFTEANDTKVQAAIDKAYKYKSKLKESFTEWITISPYKDWLGNKSYIKIDDILAQKYNIKWIFKTWETKMVQFHEDKENEFHMAGWSFDNYYQYLDFAIEKGINIPFNNITEKCYYSWNNKHPQIKSSQPSETGEDDNYCQIESQLNSYQNWTFGEKTVSTKAWFSDQFPLTIKEFTPLLTVLSYASKHMNRLNEFFSKLLIEDSLFPVKAEIPLKLSLKAVVTIHDFVNSWSK